MPSYFKCAFTHVVFGVSLFVLGIISLRLNNSGFWTGLHGYREWSLGRLISYFFLCCERSSKIRLHISANITYTGERKRSEQFLAVCTSVGS